MPEHLGASDGLSRRREYPLRASVAPALRRSLHLSFRYLGHFAPELRRNFADAVDKWQAKLILDALSEARSSSAIDSSPNHTTIFSLPAPFIQLLFSEPNLLADSEISSNLDDAITAMSSSAQPNITAPGISPLLVRLLSSPREKRRSWAMSQIPACGRRPLSFKDWCSSGVGEEVKRLYSGSAEASTSDRLASMETILRSATLSSEAIEEGAIGGRVDETGRDRSETGFVSTLSHLLGGQADCKRLFDLSAFRKLMARLRQSLRLLHITPSFMPLASLVVV